MPLNSDSNNNSLRLIFFNPNHAYCVTKTGHQTDKVGPKAPAGEYSRPESRLSRWSSLAQEYFHEFRNSIASSTKPLVSVGGSPTLPLVLEISLAVLSLLKIVSVETGVPGEKPQQRILGLAAYTNPAAKH